jgi:hypothetical protein
MVGAIDILVDPIIVGAELRTFPSGLRVRLEFWRHRSRNGFVYLRYLTRP